MQFCHQIDLRMRSLKVYYKVRETVRTYKKLRNEGEWTTLSFKHLIFQNIVSNQKFYVSSMRLNLRQKWNTIKMILIKVGTLTGHKKVTV